MAGTVVGRSLPRAPAPLHCLDILLVSAQVVTLLSFAHCLLLPLISVTHFSELCLLKVSTAASAPSPIDPFLTRAYCRCSNSRAHCLATQVFLTSWWKLLWLPYTYTLHSCKNEYRICDVKSATSETVCQSSRTTAAAFDHITGWMKEKKY